MTKVLSVTLVAAFAGLALGCGAMDRPLAAAATPAQPSVSAQNLFDVSVTRIVTQAFYNYDHNKNGAIELERPKATGGIISRIGNAWRNPDERVRRITTTDLTPSSPILQPPSAQPPFGQPPASPPPFAPPAQDTDLTITTKVYTQFPLFVAADADRDRRVTMDELREFITTAYDKNNNGNLDARGIRFWRDKNEIENFNADFREKMITYGQLNL